MAWPSHAGRELVWPGENVKSAKPELRTIYNLNIRKDRPEQTVYRHRKGATEHDGV